MSPTVHYDRDTDAAYIRLSPEKVAESEEVSDGVVLDYDADGRIVGMEVLVCHVHIYFLVFLFLVFSFIFFLLSLVFSYVFIFGLSVWLNIKATSLHSLAI